MLGADGADALGQGGVAVAEPDDNAAMIAIAGHYKYLAGDFCDITAPPFQRVII